jgi:1-acyl-sn-glycerol-3-phosphate acyltransferase
MGRRSLSPRVRRRMVSVPAVAALALALVLAAPIWIPLAVVADLTLGRWRLPTVRLLAFAVCWAWLETLGVAAATAAWAVGRGRDEELHYRLMAWWAGRMMAALSLTCGFRPRVEGFDALASGDAVVVARHASLADSLLSAWAIVVEAGVHPRYVLKRELLADPCLDIVGHRVPNHFLDRGATDSAPELRALEELAAGVGPGSLAVIFPEGTRANDAKRERLLARLRDRDPARAERLQSLRHLLPPRPAGAAALLRGAPEADVVVAWHTGFDGTDSFGAILRRLARPLPPVRFVARRIPRAEVPADPEAFVRWLDDQWCRADAEVGAALRAAPDPAPGVDVPRCAPS